MGEKGKLDLHFGYWIMTWQKPKNNLSRLSQCLEHLNTGLALILFMKMDISWWKHLIWGWNIKVQLHMEINFKNGYLGRDLSGTGWGLKWDFIIVHESGHEWFGNNITTKDIADMWVHEGFTDYSETLFIEYYFGKEAADIYTQGYGKILQMISRSSALME